MNIVVTGSIAYDYLMSFPGSLSEQIMPDQLHRLSLSFLVDGMDKRRGGCAPNIAYTLALLGEKPRLMGAVGPDFNDYRQWLELVGVDTKLVSVSKDKFTASFFCTTDINNCQIASFYGGAMADADKLSIAKIRPKPDLVIISPNDPQAMLKYAEECKANRIRFIFDPGQQCARYSGDELKQGILGANIVICNDYEFSLIQNKTGLTEKEILHHTDALIITMGSKGSSVLTKEDRYDVIAVPEDHIVDPTGVGDAFRGGLIKGMAINADWVTCARIGSVAATYALEHVGGQSHKYTITSFKRRYQKHFGKIKLL
jgi:adenosine kinase